jgi:hypothetical protein
MAKKKTEEPEFRKAILKKRKQYRFGKHLNKGEEVFVKAEYAGHQRYVYTAYRKKDDTLGFGLLRSEFEYTEKTKFIVCVQRISSSMKNVEVEALDEKEANRLALENAGDLEFKEDNAEYETVGMALTEAQHKKTFGK